MGQALRFLFYVLLSSIKLANPTLVLTNLHVKDNIANYRAKLHGQSGIYGIVNLTNGKQYIGSAANLGTQFYEHVSPLPASRTGSKSNGPLQAAIAKYGLNQFAFVVYEYAPYVLPNILDLETSYITAVPAHLLYNIKLSGTSM